MTYLLNEYRLCQYLIGRNKREKIPLFVNQVGSNDSRHIFFHADWPNEDKWFVKQPFFIDSHDRFNFLNEAKVASTISKIGSAVGYIPKVIDYNPVHKILISERPVGYTSITKNTDVLKPSVLMAGNLLEQVGTMMANLHSQLTKTVKSSAKQYQFYYFKPSLLTHNAAFLNPLLHNENIPLISRNWLSSLFFKPNVSQAIFALSQSWKTDVMIHGDATFDNILFYSDDGEHYTVKLCDWEFGGWGDPDWDIANFFQGLLCRYMTMCINHDLIWEAGRHVYNAYTNIYTNPLPPFVNWFDRILKLAAASLLKRLLGDSISNMKNDNEDKKILPGRDITEFLVNHVLINPNLFNSFLCNDK